MGAPHDSTETRTPRLDGARPMPAPGEVLAGRFRLEREVGHGGAGVVYAALDRTIGQRVAVKVLDPALASDQTRERLRREVSASRPAHPNTVTVYDLYEDGDLLFLAMELVDGASLRDRLREDGPLSVSRTAVIGGQVAAALAHLHARGIVHRDVKPGNILLEGDGTVRLCDTGLARPLVEGVTVTESRMVVGTPAYMPPEQATASELSTASDVYALGLTLYACLTGTVPLEGSTAVATLVRRQRSRPPGVRPLCAECPRWFDRLIRRMLEPRPSDRPSAADVERMLATGKVRPRPRRRHLAAAAAVVLLVALAGLLAERLIRDDATVRIEVLDAEVRGVGDRGRVTWTRSFSGSVYQTATADLDGDGVDEVVVATQPPAGVVVSSEPGARSEILAVARTGRVVARMVPDEAVAWWNYPYPKRLEIHFELHDVDADGLPEIVAPCHVVALYPTAVMVWWGPERGWDEVLLHPGRLYATAPLPAADGPGLAFIGVNNELGMLPVAGRLRLGPRLQAGHSGRPTVLTGAPLFGVPVDELSYTLLDERLLTGRWGGGELELEADGTIVVPHAGVRIDPWGNPVPGPNAGVDLAAGRARFFELLKELSHGDGITEEARVEEILATAERELPQLLAERPYRATLEAVAARALAQLGRHELAVRRLDDALAVADYDGLAYLKAHLLGAAGEIPAATAAARALVSDPHTQRGRFDGVVLRMRLAIESRDPMVVDQTVDALVRFFARPGRRSELTTALTARVNLWWDVPREVDCSAESSSYEPAGEALAALARWRRGRAAEDDVEAMRRLERVSPDAAAEAALARAAAHLGLDQPKLALSTIEALIATLESDAHVDFYARQHLHLARALRVKSLLAAGEPVKAQAAARDLLDSATPGLLPAILAVEVVALVSASSAVS